MQQSIVKCYCFVVQTLLNMFRALQCPSSGARQTAVAASGFRMNVEVEVFWALVDLLANRPRLRTLPPPHSYGNQRLQWQFDGLLMMGIVMPETCWAVPVRQSNKFNDWLLHLVGCFIRLTRNPPENTDSWHSTHIASVLRVLLPHGVQCSLRCRNLSCNVQIT